MRGPETRRGDTIISLADRHAMKLLSVEEGDSDLVAEAARKLFKIRYAGTDGHLRSASFLVQRRYSWRGYNISSPAAMQANRITLSAYDRDEVVATISIGVDSRSGLFVDALFTDELRSLRGPNRRVCEFTRLAIDEALRSKPVIAALFHTAYIYARRIRTCTDLVVEVNPRHVKFYEHMLGFHPIGPVRVDSRVQAPAILLHLDLRHAEAQIAKFGGNTELAARVRSLYPFCLAPRDEARIERRLRAFD
jgi:GNAT superfamily N-acetyltransferase